MQIYGRRFDTGQPVRLDVAPGKTVQLTPWRCDGGALESWPWIAPALIDIQFNGYGGQEFSSLELTPEKVIDIARQLDAFGVARFCPTLTTERFEVLQYALRTIVAACDASPQTARRIAGIHLEGPYISAEDGARGAHPKEHCRPPDWNEFQQLQEAAEGRIRILTMSVEFDGAAQFVARASRSGVVVGIGHTTAHSAQIRAAVDAGARLSTHLGNGSHAMLPRHSNYVWDQLAEDRLLASLICDGHHLPPQVVKTFVRAKTPERCILISDMAGQAGLPPGCFHGDLCDVEVLPSGRLVVAGQTELMAGASMPIGAGVANVVQFAGVSLAEAVRMAVERPADLLGIQAGGLEPGNPADLVQFRLARRSDPLSRHFEVLATFVDGQLVFGSPESPV